MQPATVEKYNSGIGRVRKSQGERKQQRATADREVANCRKYEKHWNATLPDKLILQIL